MSRGLRIHSGYDSRKIVRLIFYTCLPLCSVVLLERLLSSRSSKEGNDKGPLFYQYPYTSGPFGGLILRNLSARKLSSHTGRDIETRVGVK